MLNSVKVKQCEDLEYALMRNDLIKLVKFYECGYDFSLFLEKVNGLFYAKKEISQLTVFFLTKVAKKEDVFYD